MVKYVGPRSPGGSAAGLRCDAVVAWTYRRAASNGWSYWSAPIKP